VIYAIALTDGWQIEEVYYITSEAARDPIVWRYTFEKFADEGLQDAAIRLELDWICYPRRGNGY
jgi:hypothetical protein